MKQGDVICIILYIYCGFYFVVKLHKHDDYQSHIANFKELALHVLNTGGIVQTVEQIFIT